VSSLSQINFVSEEFTGHHSQRTESLGDNVTFDITVVVFAGPNHATISLQHLSDHIIDESVFKVDSVGFEFLFVFVFVDFFECVFEHAVISLEDCVFGTDKHGILSEQSILEAVLSKVFDGEFCVVHT
jgi:hypothetical protein